jgi:TPR repeat protein
MSVLPQSPDQQSEAGRKLLADLLADGCARAEKGDAVAQLLLGLRYYCGDGVAMDDTEAAKWWRKAAEQNLAVAQFCLGRCYHNGQGVTKDEVEAVKWYRKAAEQNHAQAQYELGVCYDNSQGVAEDEGEAVKWYRKAAEQGNADAQYSLGVCYDNGRGVAKDEVEAAKWYRKAAEQNYAQVQNNLGACYHNGQGVTKDEVEAVKWYRKAAEQGHADAQCSLGYCYERGQGVPEDEVEAVEWYLKAGEQGHAQAQCNLGVCYENGQGVAKDEVEAAKWYRKAAEQNHAQAQHNLGVRYADGRGVVNNLGWCYAAGHGIAKDDGEAVNWYRKAAEQNHAQAQYKLGVCYENGQGVAKDEGEAVKWYRRAAEQNDADAQYALGVCYDSGQGVAKDEVEAAKWYRKAAEQNHAQAQYNLQSSSAPSIQQELPRLDGLMSRLNSLIGLSKVKEDAARIINLVKVRRIRQQKGMKVTPMSLHLVFTGNPGTGKTTVARLLGEIYHEIGILSKGHLTETDRSGLVAGYLGQTAIKVSEVVQGALGGILFIDEAYSLAQEAQRDQFGREAIDTLLKRMEDHRDDLIVIVAGYTAPMKAFLESNPGLHSRFNKFLHFDDYSPQELFQIFTKYCEDDGYAFDGACTGRIMALINLTHERRAANFGNARTIRNLFEQTISNHANRVASITNPSQSDLTTILPQDVPTVADPQ